MKAHNWTVLCLVLAMAGGAQAQIGSITLGGQGRNFAMGGTGIAGQGNPAATGFSRGPLSLKIPTLGLRTGGALRKNVSALQDFVTQEDSADAAAELGRKFAQEDSSFGLMLGAGVRLMRFDAGVSGMAQGYIQPNATLRAWGASGAIGDPPAGSRADVLALGLYSLPAVSVASVVAHQNEQPVSLGVRVRYVNAIYSHFVAQTNSSGGFSASAAPEMGGADKLDQKGLAADLGLMTRKEQSGGTLTTGLLIANLIKPGISFAGTDRAGAARIYSPLATTISLGGAWKKGSTALAADLVDLTGAAGSRELRLGAEQKLGPLALRAGLVSGGVTYGIGLFGLDISAGKKQPLELGRTFRF